MSTEPSTNPDPRPSVPLNAEGGRLLHELSEAHELLRADLEATHRLLKVSTLFLQAGNLDSVLGEIIDAAIAITGADFGNLQLLDTASGDLKIAAQRGFPERWLTFWNEVSKGHGACGTALERHERVIIEDVEASPIFAGSPALAVQLEAGVRAVQSTPLFGRAGLPIGMLSTHYRTKARPNARALQHLDLLARQAADILERARAEQALEEANLRLREADRRKNEFLGMLSHELRNPLAPICNGIAILDHSAPGGEQALRAQAVIRRQVEHLTHLIDDLLDVTRITSGKLTLRCEPLDLGELVRRTVEDYRGAFAVGGVGLELRPAPSAVWVNGDATRLSQVVGNLLQNAAKFTPRGGKTTLSVENDVARGQAIVSVQDTGRGIAPALLPSVFEAFTQAEAPLDRAEGGLGLGLAVVKGLIEMHGGSIRGESSGVDKGSTFTIALPLEVEGAVQKDLLAARPPMQRRHILVIEDNGDAADTLRALLELRGHAVEVASTGPEGLEKALALRPDVVLCDVGLPEMDGYEVARAMRANPILGRATLVALTGYAGPEHVARATDAGFDAHLVKPCAIAALERVLAQAKR